MAFGDYATLVTDFTGADESPLSDGGNWAKVNADTIEDLRRVSNQASNTYGGGTSGGYRYWTPALFGPDVEVYVTYAAKCNAMDLYLRLTQPGGHSDFHTYLLQVEGSTWGIYSQIGGSFLGSATQAVTAGDKIGFRIQCWTLDAHIYTAGAWSQVLSVTDTSHFTSVPGYVGIGLDENTGRIDDLYVGTIPRLTPCGFVPQIYRRV